MLSSTLRARTRRARFALFRPTARSGAVWTASPLLQRDFAHQLRGHGLAHLKPFLSKDARLCLAAQYLVAHTFGLGRLAVHRGKVFVLDRDSDVPIFGTGLGRLDEYFVVNDDPLFLLFIEEWLGTLPQAGEVGIHLVRLHPDGGHTPYRTFRVVFLRERRQSC